MDLTPMDAFKAVSYIVNAVIVGFWVRKKIFLNYYLDGRWEGSLIDVSDPDFVIDCGMYVSNHRETCRANIVYTTRDKNTIVRQGVDKLVSFDDDEFLPTTWNPTFVQEFCVVPSSSIDANANATTYAFHFKICKRWFKDRMRASITTPGGRQLEGLWYRQ